MTQNTKTHKKSQTQNIHKKLKPSLVASCDIRPGNGEGLFLFQCFINLLLTYLYLYHLYFTYLYTYLLTYNPGTHTEQVNEIEVDCLTRIHPENGY